MSAAPRLFVDDDLAPGARIALGEEAGHYLSRVLRLGSGARVRVFNGRHGEVMAVIRTAVRDRVEVEVESVLRPQSFGSNLWLLFAPLKKTRTDFVVEKASELGVSEIRPVLTARCEAQTVRADRLERIAIEAAEQCERLDAPRVREAVSLQAALANWEQGRRLYVCEEGEETSPGRRAPSPALRDVLEETPPGAGAVLVGPEGGWTAGERQLLEKQGFVRKVSLGPRILRAETAALAALALWQAIHGDGRSR